MNPSTHKKVVVRTRLTGLVCGVLAPEHLTDAAVLELLTPEGQALALDPTQVQAVFFVADWGRARELQGDGYLGHIGPRLPGLWVRLQGRGRLHLEGILTTDLLELAAGVWLAPLYQDSPWQRLFVPRAAIEQVTAVEVVRSPRRRRTPVPERPDQFDLFGPEEVPAERPDGTKN